MKDHFIFIFAFFLFIPNLKNLNCKALAIFPTKASRKSTILECGSRICLLSKISHHCHSNILRNTLVPFDDEKGEASKKLSFRGGHSSEDGTIFGLPAATVKPLGLLYLAQFVLFIGVGIVLPVLPIYGKAIGLSSASNGMVIAAPALGVLLLARPAGKYADIARKPAMLLGMALIAISDFATALSTTLIPLVISRLGLGLGRCISENGERGMLADLGGTVPSFRGRVLSIQQAVYAGGIALGALVGGTVVETYGPRAGFLCVTAAAMFTLAVYTFLPETKNSRLSADGKREKNAMGWRDLLKDPRWRSLSLLEIGARFGFAAKLASIPVIAATVLPGGAVGAGGLLSASGFSALIGGPIGGMLTDRIGAKRTVITSGIFSGISLLSVPLALRISLPEFLPNGSFFIAAVLLWSAAVAAQGTAFNALTQELAPVGAEATAMSLPRAAGDSCYLVAPFLLGIIADWTGTSLGIDVAIAGLFGLLGVAALMFT